MTIIKKNENNHLMSERIKSGELSLAGPISFAAIWYSCGAVSALFGLVGFRIVVVISFIGLTTGLVAILRFLHATAEKSPDIEEKRSLINEKSNAKEK